ncbi:MAG: hypothetical protein IID05_06035 [Gemmatimonadetes bacterium]|nr:hypothetical protein [Gemmatimonadota bacterium]
MSLAKTLRRLKEHSAEKNPALAELVDRSTRELRESGIMERVLKVGNAAPPFDLRNIRGESVTLVELLEQGPVAISFYRGKW